MMRLLPEELINEIYGKIEEILVKSGIYDPDNPTPYDEEAEIGMKNSIRQMCVEAIEKGTMNKELIRKYKISDPFANLSK